MSKAIQKIKPAALAPAEQRMKDERLAMEGIRQMSGAKFDSVASRTLGQVATALGFSSNHEIGDWLIPSAEALFEFKPTNAVEAMLAAQMLSVNSLIVKFTQRASREDLPTEVVDANVHRATRLMRLFIDQTEAMAKLKGTAGQQKMTVEHVHVYEGGQAIVGQMSPGGQGGGKRG